MSQPIMSTYSAKWVMYEEKVSEWNDWWLQIVMVNLISFLKQYYIRSNVKKLDFWSVLVIIEAAFYSRLFLLT